MSTLKLRGKFLLPIAILVIALFIGVAMGATVKRRTDRFLTEMRFVHLPRIELATEARNSFATAKLYAVHYFLAPSATQRELDRRALLQQLAATDDWLRKFIELGGGGVAHVATEIRRAIAENRYADVESVTSAADSGYSAGDLADLYISRNDASPALELLVSNARAELAQAQDESDVMRSATVRIVVVLGLLSLLGSVLTMRWVLRTQLAAPLQRLHGRMMDIAALSVEDLAARSEGVDDSSLTAPIPELDRADELGAMASAVDMLRKDKALAVTLMRRLDGARIELAEQAKMASLGTIVAGVAHEINTPIGICVTGSSGIMEEIEELLSAQQSGTLDPEFLTEGMQRINDYAALVLANMTRAGALVASFKQIAVDQTADMVRRFELGAYARQIVETVGPELVKAKVAVVVDCPTPIEVTARPSAMWQILSNLILNATRHAFGAGDRLAVSSAPLVTITIRRKPGTITIEVADNGVGVTEEVRRHMFDPFFTTRRGDGGSGLGLTIAYNLVTRTLRGSIVCVSRPGAGARFIISIPETQNLAAAPA